MPVWHWLPCLAGRSMRPILERVDSCVRHVSAAGSSEVPSVGYGPLDLYRDFCDNPGGVMEVHVCEGLGCVWGVCGVCVGGVRSPIGGVFQRAR